MKMKAKFELDMDEAIWIRFALKELIKAPHGLSDSELSEIQNLYYKLSDDDNYEFVKEEDE